jgi:hypothetical protein
MSSDGAFRDRYWATYRERPSDTLKRAGAEAESSARRGRSCRLPRMREEVASATPSSCGGAWPDARYLSAALGPAARLSAGLRRAVATDRGARTNDLAGQGARARKPWKNADAVARRERINGDELGQRGIDFFDIGRRGRPSRFRRNSWYNLIGLDDLILFLFCSR